MATQTQKISDKKHQLKHITLFDEDGQYYLRLVYRIEDESSIKELEIPKVRLPFSKNAFPELKSIYFPEPGLEHFDFPTVCIPQKECKLKTGFNNTLEVCKAPSLHTGGMKVFYSEKTIEEKRKEMTIAEIEKKLGHKIKIIGE
jgi:hypothetical protein